MKCEPKWQGVDEDQQATDQYSLNLQVLWSTMRATAILARSHGMGQGGQPDAVR